MFACDSLRCSLVLLKTFLAPLRLRIHNSRWTNISLLLPDLNVPCVGEFSIHSHVALATAWPMAMWMAHPECWTGMHFNMEQWLWQWPSLWPFWRHDWTFSMARQTDGDGALETHKCIYTQINITHLPMRHAGNYFPHNITRITLPPTTVEPGIIYDISYFKAYVCVF